MGLLALQVLGSVWKALLREVERRVIDLMCFWGVTDPAHPLRSAWALGGSMAYPEQGCLGFFPAQLPPRSMRKERKGQGFKGETWHLLASWKC